VAKLQGWPPLYRRTAQNFSYKTPAETRVSASEQLGKDK